MAETTEEKKTVRQSAREPVFPVVMPREKDAAIPERLRAVLSVALAGRKARILETAEELEVFLSQRRSLSEIRSLSENRPAERILFVLSLGADGVNLEYARLLRFLRRAPGALDGYTGGVIADSESDLFTKSAARELVFAANCAGCAFVGRPLVEGTGTLSNFAIVARNLGTDWAGAYRESAAELVRSVLETEFVPRKKPVLLALHASSHKTSNTWALWSEVRKRLDGFEIQEIGLRNGTLSDCSGCPYKMCLHFGERGSCFYGGVMAEDVYPAVRRADGIIMLCPNYNDALSANLTAFINRLTALFRTVRFYDKALFGIVVSGYSGSDIVAEQLIAALNMNKTFYLPGGFTMMETANDAGTALKLPGIEGRIDAFAGRIRRTLLAGAAAEKSGAAMEGATGAAKSEAAAGRGSDRGDEREERGNL